MVFQEVGEPAEGCTVGEAWLCPKLCTWVRYSRLEMAVATAVLEVATVVLEVATVVFEVGVRAAG